MGINVSVKVGRQDVMECRTPVRLARIRVGKCVSAKPQVHFLLTLLMLWLGSGTRTTWLGFRNIHVLSKLPVLVATNMNADGLLITNIIF